MGAITQVQERTLVSENIERDSELLENAVLDFKMITFSLLGKDYAINIMDVKEIAKTGCFTYVPNTMPFVLGVHNLRGEIIPIIDLRLFFHISNERPDGSKQEDMIIVTVEDQTFGVVVDSIDKVIPISKSSIQPPHPVFGDINIKYIRGVVESQNKLYILLDIKKIFTTKTKEELEDSSNLQNVSTDLLTSSKAEEARIVDAKPVRPGRPTSQTEVLNISFIAQTLASFKNFFVSPINEAWVMQRFSEWQTMRSQDSLQLKTVDDAELFLEGFSSPFTGTVWSDAYAKEVMQALPDLQNRNITVWNIGCGKGAETFSLAILLKEKYGSSRVKIYANDSDLLAITNAPNYTFKDSSIPERIKPYLVKNVAGEWTFNQEIRDMILFEYHDCTNENPYPDMDLIFCRDLISFLNKDAQNALLADMKEKLKVGGCVIVGANEELPFKEGWNRSARGNVAQFSL